MEGESSKINFASFTTIISAIKPNCGIKPHSLLNAFNLIDKSNTGKVNLNSFKQLLISGDNALTPQQVPTLPI